MCVFQEEQSTGCLVECACEAWGDLSRAVLAAVVALVHSGWEGLWSSCPPRLAPDAPPSACHELCVCELLRSCEDLLKGETAPAPCRPRQAMPRLLEGAAVEAQGVWRPRGNRT